MSAIHCPTTLPLFPLTGVLLLPGAHIPLHVFEPRYRSMIQDALAEEPVIGLIQPLVPQIEDDDPEDSEHPALYSIGCAGVIEHWERLADGRMVMLVRGVQRFRWIRELPGVRGYRRVEVDYQEFVADLDDAGVEIDPAPLMRALKTFAEAHQITLELNRLEQLPGRTLLNSVAMALPFAPAEKQALLEAPHLPERYAALLTLMDMGIELMNSDLPASAILN